MRALLLGLALLAATPSTAAAAFGEITPLKLTSGADCVRPTGAPGQLAVASDDGVRLVGATREGFVFGESIPFATNALGCTTTLARPSGATVLAGRGDSTVVVTARDPGGAWTPAEFAVGTGWYADAVTPALSDRGDVLVTWRESRGTRENVRYRFRAVRRSPGAGFGPVETIGAASPRNAQFAPAISGTGEAFLLVTRAEDGTPPYRVSAMTAAPGGAFGPPVALATMPWASSAAIVASEDGRALVAVPDGTSMLVAERAPGGAFGAATAIAAAPTSGLVNTSAAVGPNGEAAVAWAGGLTGEGRVVTRPAGGAFGTARGLGRLTPRTTFDPILASQALLGPLLALFDFSESPSEPLTLTPDGRVLVAWYDATPLPVAQALLSAPLAGGPLTSASAGRGVGDAEEGYALSLPDGSAGLAWMVDDQLHFATEGASSPAPLPLPRVTVGAPRERVLGPKSKLRLPVRCGGPCELVGELSLGLFPASGNLTLPRGGRGVLTIDRAGEALSGPRTRVPIQLTYAAPKGLDARSRTVRVTLDRRAGAPDTRLRDVRAVRQGNAVRVSWSIAGRATDDDSAFIVTAGQARDHAEAPSVFRFVASHAAKTSYVVTLRVPDDVRWVAVRSDESLLTGRPALAKVR